MDTGHYAEQDPEPVVKVKKKKKRLEDTVVKFNYSIRIKNEGEIAGYAKNIVDYIPASLEFMSSLNEGWYKKDKNIYNESLKDKKIEPGETKELTLVLSKTMTKSNTGLINNKAKIYTEYNEQGIEDKTEDIGEADILITVSTGSMLRNMTIFLMAIICLCGGMYFIKKENI